MMNIDATAAAQRPPRHYLSDEEEIIASALSNSLPPKWSVELESRSIEISLPDGNTLRYQPDFVLRDQQAGRTLIVEIKNLRSMSITNMIKFGLISAAYRERGCEFLMLVLGEDPTKLAHRNPFVAHGITAFGVVSGQDAVAAIHHYLLEQRGLPA